MLGRAGVDVVSADPAARGRAAIAGGAFLTGSASEVAERLAEFIDAGADEIVFSVTGVCLGHGPQAALAELDALFGEVVPLLPAGATAPRPVPMTAAGR
jgi:hypothetical protein